MIVRKFLAFTLTCALAACGGGSGADAGGSSGGNQTGKDLRTLALSGMATVDGSPVRAISVNAYDYRDGSQGAILVSGSGSAEGFFNLSTQVESDFAGLVLLCASGGIYTDGASAKEVTLTEDDQLCTMVNIQQNGSAANINLTPFSHAFSQLVIYNIGLGSSHAAAVSQAASHFSDTFKFSHNVKPHASVSDSSAFNDESLSHTLLSGYSAIAMNNDAQNGVLAVSGLLAADIIDGTLDGIGRTSGLVANRQLGIGGNEFTGQTYTADALIAGLNAKGLNLNSGLGASASLYIPLYSSPSSGSLVPSSQAIVDVLGPTISFSHEAGASVSGDFALTVTAADENLPRVSNITVNGLPVPDLSGGTHSFTISPSQLGTSEIEITAQAQDAFGNQSFQTIVLNVVPDTASLRLASSAITKFSGYRAEFEILTGAVNPDSVKINGLQAFNANQGTFFFTDLTLSYETTNITVTFETQNGYSIEQHFTITLDTTPPFLQRSQIDGHTVYVKEVGAAEAVLKPFDMISLNDQIYIDSSLQSLNGLAVTPTNIVDYHLPVVFFTVNEELQSFSYEYTNEFSGQIKTGDLVNVGTGWVLPLSTEYLGANWFKNTGQQAIYFTATDLVGNASSTTYQGYFTGWAPSLTTSITVSTVFGGSDATLEFNSEDFTGMDEVKLVINGVEYSAISITNPSFSVDFSGYASGQYYGYVKAYKDGAEVFSQRVDFTVSNEPSTITVTSPYYFNTSSPVLAGTAVNSQDGIASVLVGGLDASYQLFNNTFSRAFSNLPEGVHLATVKAISGSGYSNQITTEFAVDTTMPVATISDPGNGWYTGSTFTVSGTCADVTSGGIQSGVASMKLNGNAVSCSSSAYSHALAVTTGTNVITAAITDQAGNEGTATEYVKVDNVLPLGTITNPGASWRTGSSYTVTGTCSDAHSGVAGVTVNSKSTSCVNGEYSVSVPVTQGVNTLTTNVADMVGQTYSTNRTLNIDNTPAELEVTTPIYFTQADLDIRSTTTDAESGVTGVTVNGNNATWNTVDEQYSYRFYGIAEGVYPIDVVATNGAGLTTTVSNTYYVDKSVPNLAIEFPYPGNNYTIKQNNGGGTFLAELTLSNGGLYFCPENVALNGMATDDSTLFANGMIFINFYAEDIYSNGAGTDRGDLEVWFEYYKNDEIQLTQSLVNDGTGYYKIIVSEETLGQFYLNTTVSDSHQIIIYSKDNAGNTKQKFFDFKVYYDPTSADW